MTLIDQLKSFSTSTVIVTACEIAEGRLEVFTKSYAQDSVYADEELIAAGDEVAFLLANIGWTCDAEDPGNYQIWTH